MVGMEDVRRARERTADLLHRTPLVCSATLSRLAGGGVFLKLENLQKTGSFKPRGALNKIRTIDPESLAAGVITISAGNHAQALAYVASHVGARAVVVMPETASSAKVEATRGYGAEVILHGDAVAAFRRVEEVGRQRGLTFVHPFDDDATIAGQGTVGLELLDDLPEVDQVVVAVGGGGLLAGVAVAIKTARPSARVVGVEPTGAAAMHLSRQRGSPSRLDRVDTIADGLAAPFAGARNFAIVQRYVDDLVLVEDDAIRAAMRLLLERCKLLAEPAGAAPVAALLSGRVPARGATVAVISGGNVALETIAGLLRP